MVFNYLGYRSFIFPMYLSWYNAQTNNSCKNSRYGWTLRKKKIENLKSFVETLYFHQATCGTAHFSVKRRQNGGYITQKTLRALTPAIGPLIVLFSGRDGSFPEEQKSLDARGIFGEEVLLFGSFHSSPFLKFRSTSLPPRISNPPLSLYFLE